MLSDELVEILPVTFLGLNPCSNGICSLTDYEDYSNGFKS